MNPMMVIFALITAHCFFDYAGQGDFMSKAKNIPNPIPGVPFWQPLLAHSIIHGFAVAFITGFWALGVLEIVVHFITDNAKCRGKLDFSSDQAIHIVAKFAWWKLWFLLTAVSSLSIHI